MGWKEEEEGCRQAAWEADGKEQCTHIKAGHKSEDVMCALDLLIFFTPLQPILCLRPPKKCLRPGGRERIGSIYGTHIILAFFFFIWVCG